MPKAPKKTTVPAEPAAGNSFTRLLFRPKVLVLTALAVSSTALGPMFVGWLPDLADREEYRLPTSKIHITEPPHWVPSDLIGEVADRSDLSTEVSLLDEGANERIAEAFRQHPWVAEIVAVRKSLSTGIEVELIYRKPVAIVHTKMGLYPIDSEAVLLPPDDFSASDTRRYPAIHNVDSLPQGPAGTEWGDVGVLAAARLAEVLDPTWQRFQLAAIRVPRRMAANDDVNTMTFELITASGSRIIWGRAPGTGHPGELTAKQKIARLEKYLSDFGSFDHPHGPYEIDIRHWQEISRRPLSASRGKIRL